MDSKQAHADAAKNLKRNYKKFSSVKPMQQDGMGTAIEHPGLDAQENKAVRQATATAGKKKGK